MQAQTAANLLRVALRAIVARNTPVSFAKRRFSLPKKYGRLARVNILATPALAEAVRAAMGALTYEEVQALGGPSSPTLTKILRGDGDSISRASARALERALGWPRDAVAAAATGNPIHVAGPTESDRASVLASISEVALLNELLRRARDRTQDSATG